MFVWEVCATTFETTGLVFDIGSPTISIHTTALSASMAHYEHHTRATTVSTAAMVPLPPPTRCAADGKPAPEESTAPRILSASRPPDHNTVTRSGRAANGAARAAATNMGRRRHCAGPAAVPWSSKRPTLYWVEVYFVTALVPSDTACLASSPGSTSRTLVCTSREDRVAFPL